MKRRLIALLFAVLLVTSPAGAISFVQAANNLSLTATASTVTVTTTSGNLLVLCTGEGANNSSTVSITDSASQSWTQVGSYVNPNTSSRSSMWMMPNSASITSVTATWSGSLSTNVEANLFEISAAAASPLDTSNTSSSSSVVTSITTGAITTTQAQEILVACARAGANQGSTWSAGAGYTLPSNATNDRVGMTYQIVSSIQTGVTTSISWSTTSATAISIFAGFKDAGAAVAPKALDKRRKLERIDE